MTTRTDAIDRKQIAAHVAPVVIVALAGIAVRTPVAARYPFAALLLFLWVVADTLMLSLVARSTARPAWRVVLAVLAGVMAAVVLAHVGLATARARRVAGEKGVSARERWASAAAELFPPALVRLAAAELSVIHLALFRWGGPADVPADARAFSYHRHLTPMCVALLILSAIEIMVYHLLVGHWSRTAAIVMFVLSDVGFVYLVGLIKSFRFRPVLLTPEGVRVRAGFLIDQLVPFDAIVAVDVSFTGEEVRDAATLNASLLAWPNVMLRLDRPLPRRTWLRRGSFARIAFRLDDPAPFVRLLAWRVGQRPG